MGCATLQYRAGPDGDDSGRQYFTADTDHRTYRLKTNEDDPVAGTYDDLAVFAWNSGPDLYMLTGHRWNFQGGSCARAAGQT